VKTRLFGGAPDSFGHTLRNKKGGNMKKLLALIALTSCLAVPSFAGDVVGHSAKAVGKDSAKAVRVTAKDTAKAGVKVVKALF
jgi:hypothetical protein